MKKFNYVLKFSEICRTDTVTVGGKNASLGEMYNTLQPLGIRVPNGFATTASAFRDFIEFNHLFKEIHKNIESFQKGDCSLADTGKEIRHRILNALWPQKIQDQICQAYQELCSSEGNRLLDVAVRSSATAEDLPEASFAGQQETYLNIKGEQELMFACRRCYASLFTDRAISYRENKGFDHLKIALSIGVQKMVRSDMAGAGVLFTLDTETGFPDVITIDAAWGLGENVVQGTVIPDNYIVFKPLLKKSGLTPILKKTLGTKSQKMVYSRQAGSPVVNVPTAAHEQESFVLDDAEILQLGRWASQIEEHYGHAMDIEWAKDGVSGDLYIVQARPETVHSRENLGILKTFHLEERTKILLAGLAIGDAISVGEVQVIKSTSDINLFVPGNILVTGMTDPDWVPIMKKAAGIITDHGGRTSHAAIVSRELGVAAIVGTGKGTTILKDGMEVTLCCAEGDEGHIYSGRLKFTEREVDLKGLPELRTQIMLNIATPSAAMRWWKLPCRGIGLARMEFIINNLIQVHPMALVPFEQVKDDESNNKIRQLTKSYSDKVEYFVDQLAQGIAVIAASQYPHEVIVRMSDFKTNEYAQLTGGQNFEFKEENPMLGFRGASRYYDARYKPGFSLECAAIKRAREHMGLSNIIVMIPFCRTLDEADKVLDVMADNGLMRGEGGLQVYVMVEIPSNVILAEQFAKRFDGFSIGSNDLTQLTLGVDRDSDILKDLFDERDPAVKAIISQAIRTAHTTGTKIGICGQAPSDYPDFAAFLVSEGIDSISLNPDSVIEVVKHLGQIERERSAN